MSELIPLEELLRQNYEALQQRMQSGDVLLALPSRYRVIANAEVMVLAGKLRSARVFRLCNSLRNRHLALNAAYRSGISDVQRPVLIYAPGMAETAVSMQLLALVAGEDISVLQAGAVGREIQMRLAGSAGALAASSLHILGGTVSCSSVEQLCLSLQAESESALPPLIMVQSGDRQESEWAHDAADRLRVALLLVE